MFYDDTQDQMSTCSNQSSEFDDKLTQEDKNTLNDILNSLKEAHSKKEFNEIDLLSKKLNETWNDISTRLYENSDNSNDNTGSTEEIPYEEVN